MAGESQQLPKSEPDPSVITTEIIDKEIAHLRELVYARLAIIENLMTERDLRYSERFNAQQLAVHDAREEDKERVDAAFAGSEKAILKAEVSIEKRADATYVSLQDLTRQLAVLMPRAEVEARLSAITDGQATVATRVERIEAVRAGSTAALGGLLAVATLVIAVVVVVVNVLVS